VLQKSLHVSTCTVYLYSVNVLVASSSQDGGRDNEELAVLREAVHRLNESHAASSLALADILAQLHNCCGRAAPALLPPIVLGADGGDDFRAVSLYENFLSHWLLVFSTNVAVGVFVLLCSLYWLLLMRRWPSTMLIRQVSLTMPLSLLVGDGVH
jgi:hypothetical protein